MTPAARLQAVVDILEALDATAQPADRLLRDWFKMRRYAGSKDRAAVAERVYAIQRHRASLGWRMGSEAPRALVIASLLAERCSAVDIVASFDGSQYGPAVLTAEERRALAAAPLGAPPLHARGEYPAFLEPELRLALGDAVLEEMLALQERAPVDLRVNTLKASRETVMEELRAEGFDAGTTCYSPFALRIPPGEGSARLGTLPLFESGGFEFQDEAAQIASLLCGARPGMSVLDYAAGAGGKSLALAAIMQNRGEIVAHDIFADRLHPLAERASRAGASIIRIPPPERGRPTREAGRVGVSEMILPRNAPRFDPLPTGEAHLFDIVLVDAPCSGTGTWRRQPELRWRITPARLAELFAVQDRLLEEGAPHVKPGGRLVYATCSILPSENEVRVGAFLARHPEFGVAPAEAQWTGAPVPGLGRFFRAAPRSTGTDGFFTAVLTRVSGQIS